MRKVRRKSSIPPHRYIYVRNMQGTGSKVRNTTKSRSGPLSFLRAVTETECLDLHMGKVGNGPFEAQEQQRRIVIR